MSEQVVTSTSEQAAPPPPQTAEDRQWAALREELEPKQEPAAEPEAAPEPARAEPESQQVEPEKVETPEQLKTNYSNLQKALQEERNLRRAEQERWKAVQELAQNLRAGKEAKAEPEKPKVLDVHEDPIGYLKYLEEKHSREIAELRNGTQQFAQQTQQDREFQQFMSVVDRSEKEIRDAKSPNYKADYDDACRHLETGRVEELTYLIRETDPVVLQNAAHYNVTPQVMAQHMRVAQLNSDRQQIAETALRNGMSPAMMYYEAAQKRGYKPSNVVALKPQEKVAMQRKAVQSSRASISGGGGSKSVDDMGLSDLASLATEDPDAFEKMWDKMAASGKLG